MIYVIIRDMGGFKRTEPDAYYIGFFALLVLGAISNKFPSVMVRRRDRRRRS